MAGGRNSPKKAQLAERRNRALELRKAGASYRAIAVKVAAEFDAPKYSEALAHGDVSSVLQDLNERTSHTAEEYRTLELERLDTAMLAIANDVRKGKLNAIDRWIRISESRRKLLGLDAPIELRVEERIEAELHQFLDQLESVLPPEIFTTVLRAVATLEARAESASAN
jgi:carboxylesterase type B